MLPKNSILSHQKWSDSMAIAFARLEFVKRSAGKNSCAKAAYQSRNKIKLDLDKVGESKIYDWSFMERPLHHELLLPEYVDRSFSSPELLWNTVEKFENRKNSVVAMELLLALPDDKVISDEDRIELSRTFVNENFIRQGFVAQIDIHRPEKNPELQKEEHNWHAHILLPTRRFKEDGLTFEKNKPREFLTTLRGGKVISGPDWGKLWMHHQNQFFESKGIALRVDPNGLVAQIHMGPKRMRSQAYSMLEELWARQELNALESLDPKMILDRITQHQNIFSKEDLDRFLHKYIPSESIEEVRQKFWTQEEIVQLLNPETREPLNKFTTQQVLDEEKKILRLSDKMITKRAYSLNNDMTEFKEPLTPEQKVAFENLLRGKRLSCIAGLAGTGKSHLLCALKKAYEKEGFIVRGLGPDNATAMVLKGLGFKKSENVFKFLYKAHYSKKEIINPKEVWILDEAGKFGSKPLLEFLKLADKHGAQVILSGDPRQIPSVERGRMFYTFCKRYGNEFLGDIKRQRDLEQREIAKKLAFGSIGLAFDQIARTGGFHWSHSKQDAMESLVKQWAIDKELFPCSSTIILAHTNAEVAALNEYVRIYKKERGELDKTEFSCDTFYGKIRISEGDKIAFRKNNNDLEVMNGQTGTIVKANESKFVVRLDDESKKEVSFNPTVYPFFQLGYATTYNRGQGGTFDRAYILHSPFMNKEAYYVGFTRHVHRVYCFVSTSEALCLSDLKRQAMRSSKIESTVDYLTRAELQKNEEIQIRHGEIENLKQSDSFTSKLKGNALHVVDKFKGTASSIIEHFSDRMPNKEFFNENKQIVNDFKYNVMKVKEDIELEKDHISGDIFKPILSSTSIPQEVKESKNPRSKAWDNLAEASKVALKDYYYASDNASSLHAIVKSEADHLDILEKNTKHFSEWQKACSERNEKAYKISHSITEKELKNVFSVKTLNILKDRSARHEIHLNRQNEPKHDLEQGLRDNLDGLLKQLFPDGPTRNDRQGYRFGSKGSLSVACRGPKEGTYYNFENGEGGGLVKLIQETLRINHEEAKNWAKNFLGNTPQTVVTQKTSKPEKEPEDSWISLKPDSKHPAPKLQSISNYLYQTQKESARHPYKDASGNLLFYTIRLVDKNDPKSKGVYPLSYGYYRGDEKPRWSLKNYQADKKPLYNLDLVTKNPHATILIVEGEKTADAAQRAFAKEGMVAVTWLGGSSAASKADWASIAYRNVIIWPDNDAPGFKACNEICSELRRFGVKSLKVVDKDILQKEFPEKWDLADPLPTNVSQQLIKDILMNTESKAIGINDLLGYLSNGKTTTISEILKAQEILWRVDTRLRNDLEQEFKGKTWEIRDKIIQNAATLLSKEDVFKTKLQTEFGLNEERSRAFAFAAMAYHASNGEMPSREQFANLATAGQNFQTNSKGIKEELKDFLVFKFYLYSLESGVKQKLPENMQKLIIQDTLKCDQQIINQITADVPKRQKVKNIEREL